MDRKKAGRLFRTDGAAWSKARLAISILTGNCFKKCLSDDRDVLFGIHSTTADLRYAGYPVSRTLYSNVATLYSIRRLIECVVFVDIKFHQVPNIYAYLLKIEKVLILTWSVN